MAHTNSALKRARQARKRTIRNRAAKSGIRTILKRTQTAIDAGDAAKAAAEFRLATQILDKAAGRHTIHPNEAARRKSRMGKRIAALAAKK